LGAVAILVSIASGSRMTDTGKKVTQATFLAQELREWTLKLPFSDTDPADVDNPPGPDGADPQAFIDDLDDLMGVTYDPPRNGNGTAINDMSGWSQTITMTWRNPNNIASTVAAGSSNVIHVDVSVARNGMEVIQTGWLVTQAD